MSIQSRVRSMEKDYAIVVDCMDMSGICVHTRVGPKRLKPQIKRLLSKRPSKRRMMNQVLASYARNWAIPPRITPCTKRQERRSKLQQEDAMDVINQGTWLMGVPTCKTSKEQIKDVFAMLVGERGI